MSTKKRLLSEAQIRRFMELSGQKTLAEPFLKRLNEECGNLKKENRFVGNANELSFGQTNLEEGDEEEELETAEDEEVGGAPEMGEPEVGGAPEMGGEEELPPEGAEGHEGGEAMVKQLVDAIAAAISDVSGVEVNVDGGGEAEMPGDELGGEMGEPEMGGELGGEPEMGGAPEMGGEEGFPPAEEEEEEAPLQEAEGLATGKVPTTLLSKGGNKTPLDGEKKDHKLKPATEPKQLNTKTGGGPTVTDKPSAKGTAKLPGEKATGLTKLSEQKRKQRFVSEVARLVTKRLLEEVKKGKKK